MSRTRNRATRLVALAVGAAALLPAAADAAWSPPFDLASGSTRRGTQPHTPALAVNGRGDAVVAWLRFARGAIRPQVRLRTRGRFGSPVTFFSGSHDAGAPAVAINDRGAALVAWTQRRRRGRRLETVVLVSYRRPGRSFAAPVSLGPAGGRPVAGIDRSGRAVVAWVARRMQAARSDSTGRFGARRGLGPTGAANPDLEVNDRGFAVLGWGVPRLCTVEGIPDTEVGGTFLVAIAPPGGAFAVPQRLGNGTSPQVAITGPGLVVVTATDTNEACTPDFSRTDGPDQLVLREAGTDGAFGPAQDLGPAAGTGVDEADASEGGIVTVVLQAARTGMLAERQAGGSYGVRSLGIGEPVQDIELNAFGLAALVTASPVVRTLVATQSAIGTPRSHTTRADDEPPAVGIDDRGRALAVWAQNPHIRASGFTP